MGSRANACTRIDSMLAVSGSVSRRTKLDPMLRAVSVPTLLSIEVWTFLGDGTDECELVECVSSSGRACCGMSRHIVSGEFTSRIPDACIHSAAAASRLAAFAAAAGTQYIPCSSLGVLRNTPRETLSALAPPARPAADARMRTSSSGESASSALPGSWRSSALDAGSLPSNFHYPCNFRAREVAAALAS